MLLGSILPPELEQGDKVWIKAKHPRAFAGVQGAALPGGDNGCTLHKSFRSREADPHNASRTHAYGLPFTTTGWFYNAALTDPIMSFKKAARTVAPE